MVNNQFSNDSFLYLRVDQEVLAGARDLLSMFFQAYGVMVNVHKTRYWLVGLDEPLD